MLACLSRITILSVGPILFLWFITICSPWISGVLAVSSGRSNIREVGIEPAKALYWSKVGGKGPSLPPEPGAMLG